MSKLDDILLTHGFHVVGIITDNDPTDEVDKIAKQSIKTLILDLFKEVDYDPFEFVAKVKEL